VSVANLMAATEAFFTKLGKAEDILDFCKAMADDDDLVAKELGITHARNAWREAAEEIERLRSLLKARSDA